MKRFTILLGLAVLFLAPVVLADVPKLINFQGILRDGSGNPVPDAVYVIRFRIYDDSTAGANLWEEFDDVQTTDGLFNVRLGDTTNLPDGLFEGSVNRFVGVKVGGDPETAPRTRLISVPFAFHTLKSDSAATATVALDLTCTGCVDATDLATDAVGADEIAPGAVGTSEIDATQVQRRVTGTAGANQYITGINQDGSVVTAIDQTGAASGWTDDGAVVRLSTGTDNVGIGTTTPQFGARLEVVDRVNVIGTGTSRMFIAKDGDEYLEASYNAGFARGQITTFNSSQPLILQQTGGNVGIGTISPGSRLQVEGQISSSVTGPAAPGFTFTGDLNTGLFETVPDELGLATNGIDRVHVTSGGSVGIGLATPTKKLEVAGSIKVGTNDTVFSSNISSNSPLALQAPAGTTRMYIDDVSGDVGLGTAAPSRNLHIFKNDNASVGLRIDNPNVGGAAQERIDFGTGSAHIRVSGASNGMSIVNNRTAGTVEFEVGGTQRLFISNSGNVGIGTNGPNKKLEVVGSVKADTVFSNVLSSNSPLSLQAPAGTTRMFISDVTGSVGIGTISPSATLHIFRSAFPSLAFDDAGATEWSFTHDGSNLNMNEAGATRTRFLPGGSVHFGITGGNVGIGTSTTTNKLDVEGGAAIGATYSGTNAAPSNGLLVEGNVGIGTASPTTRLQVAGGQLSADAGTAAAPAYTFVGDLNTGIYHPTADVIGFATNGTEGMRINSIGLVGIGTSAINAALDVERSGGDVATFDRLLADGSVVAIRQDGVTEGNISVSGTTVSYNAFTGSHYGWTEESLERGELVSLTGLNRNSHDNPKSEIIYGIKRSAVPNDPACLGSYLALSEPAQAFGPENPHLIMAVGNGDMWVVDEGESLQPGDYLISSSTPGHAVRDDEGKYPIGHIVARAAEGVDWGRVSETVSGRKHKKISVLFGNFVRSSVVSVNRLLELQQHQIERLEEKLEKMQGEKPQAKVE